MDAKHMDVRQSKLVNRLISAILTKNYVKIVLVGIAILLSVIATADGNISGRVEIGRAHV